MSMDDERVMVAYGSPASGLTLVGPMITNSIAIEQVTEWLDGRDEYWWYMPIVDPADFARERRINLGEG